MFHSSAFTSIITPVIYSKNINRATGSLGRGSPPSPVSRLPSLLYLLFLVQAHSWGGWG